MAKDLVCGMIVDEKTALSADMGGRQFYFYSTTCVNTFVNPTLQSTIKKLSKYTCNRASCNNSIQQLCF